MRAGIPFVRMVMRKTSIAGITLLALLVLAGGVFPAVGQSKPNKQDLYNLATAAAQSGRMEESVKFYCQVAGLDPNYKDSKLMCSVMTLEKQKEERKNEERFTAGTQDFNTGKYDEAEQKFKNIRFGPHYEEAQQYLKVKIPQARQAGNKGKEGEKKPE